MGGPGPLNVFANSFPELWLLCRVQGYMIHFLPGSLSQAFVHMMPAPLVPLLICWYPLWLSHLTYGPWSHFLDTLITRVGIYLHIPPLFKHSWEVFYRMWKPFKTSVLGSLSFSPPSHLIHPLLWLYPGLGHFLECLYLGNHKIHTSHSLTSPPLLPMCSLAYLQLSGSSAGASSLSIIFFALGHRLL